MRLALAVLLLVAAPVLAQDDGFKWDPSKKRAAAVGDRFFQVNEDIQQIKTTIKRGQEETPENSYTCIKYRVVHEVLAVEGDKVSKEKISIERWSFVKEEKEPEDKSLAGKTIVVEGTGEKKKVTWEGGSDGVSEEGKRWVESTFGSADPMHEIERLLPREGVANGAEWPLDTKKLANEIFQGTEIDPQKSKATGSLKNVRVEDGVHMGDVEIKIALQLKHIPSAPVEWKEGGLVDLVVTIQGSLEPEKSRKRTVRMDLKLKGRAEHDGGDGLVDVKMDMRMTNSFSVGDMPKK